MDLLAEATRSAAARAMRLDAPVEKRGRWTARMSGVGPDTQPLVFEGKGDDQDAALSALIAQAPIPDPQAVRHCATCSCEA